MLPGITAKGPRVISFDAILKYNRFPLAQIINDLLKMCKEALMCDVEMEFAADMDYRNRDNSLVLKLLQVRPVGEYGTDSNVSIQEALKNMDNVLIKSTKALGSGVIDNITHIIHVPSSTFDSAKTNDMAKEIANFNTMVRNEGGSYMLLGPGRWGSSDPWLGIPVLWSDISEAKVIVESAIPGYQIEPSQGTHFFQNITSLGVGYLTVDTVRGDGVIDEDAISKLEIAYEGEFTKLYKAPDGLRAYIDRSSNESIVGL